MIEQLSQICSYAEAHRGSLRALVLRGSGGVFCAGGDIKAFRQSFQGTGDAEAIATANRRYGALLERIDNLPLLVIAAVEGAAMGGGVGLAAAADLVIATSDTKFSLSETTLGLPPAQIAPFVTARVGRHVARRLMLTAYRFDAQIAASFGLADSVVSDSDKLDSAIDGALELVRRCAPEANAMTKSLVNAAASMALGEVLDHSAVRFAEAMLGSEAKQGVSAFLNRSKPSWAEPALRVGGEG